MGGPATLLHGGGGQRREADDVAHRVDVGDGRPLVVVDGDAAAAVGGQTGPLEGQAVGGALATGRVQDGVGHQARTARQRGDRPVGPTLDPGDRLAEAQDHAEVAQVGGEGVHDLGVAELEQPMSLIDHRHRGAEHGEHRRVLQADHPAAHHNERPGDPRQPRQGVGIDHDPPVERDVGRTGRARARGDDDRPGAHPALVARAVDHGEGGRVDEAGPAVEQPHAVALELVTRDRRLAVVDLADRGDEVDQVDTADTAVPPAEAVRLLPAPPRPHVEDGLAQRLRRDRARAQGDATERRPAVDDRGPVAELGGRHGGALATRPGAEGDEVEGGEVIGAHAGQDP